MECTPTVHCEVGEWSEWGPCSRSGKTCGFKWGEETRTRKVLQNPSSMGSPCPATSETRECLVKRRRLVFVGHCCFMTDSRPTRCSIALHLINTQGLSREREQRKIKGVEICM
ncbi:R-spondin-3-like [Sinocyclocheilus grahami]|uniref:R-spondin-3-like n=1 Tax=Sinocyclocheilus grahami TaxID=75366 RepID=UPI0007AC7EAC|nr:PREDICTED: R-spondin-3-like [Sinocyclocheilus grahami]